MKIRKRSGELQEYSSEKIKYSIIRAADETNMPVTGGDVEFFVRTIEKRLKNRNLEVVSSEEIFDEVLIVLMRNKFYKVAERYSEGANR